MNMGIKTKRLLSIPASGLLLIGLLTGLVPELADGQETLYGFSNTSGTDSAVTEGSDGNFYGTTYFGGDLSLYGSGLGSVFRMTPAGVLINMLEFNASNGGNPAAELLRATDGTFYGTTYNGGDLSLNNGVGRGTVFKMTPAGVLTTLVQFNVANGGHPAAGLVQGSDGNVYGTTYWGGNVAVGGGSGLGTVFSITPAGVLTTQVQFNANNGGHPAAGLVQGTDGNFYGTTYLGGNLSLNNGAGRGTVFKMTPAGVLTTLVKFNVANGGHPAAGLVQGSDGNFYGTTYYGGDLSLNNGSGRGTVFRITPAGVLTTLVQFNVANGAHPSAGLVQGSDGNFYGTTHYGGNLSLNSGIGYGTVFKLTPVGVVTTLVQFTGDNGSYPSSELRQGSDGKFYGRASQGGPGGGGTIFRLNLSEPLSLVQQPGDLSASPGANAQFQAIAYGTNPFTYQWRFNNQELLNATNAALNIANVQLTNGGAYIVVVTSISGSITSRVATLQIDPAFTKITTGNIVTNLGTGTGCAWGDYDNDGFVDLIVTSAFNPSNNAGQKNVLFHNNRDGTFTSNTNSPVTLEARDWRGASWADYDNDGLLDLYIASTSDNGFSAENELFRNNGNGTFTKMTAGAVGAIVPGGGGSESPVWADFDRDGFVDLYIARYGTGWLFRNNAGIFAQVTNGAVAVNQANQGSYGAVWGDYDNDGWPDLLVTAKDEALQNQTNFLYHNTGNSGFSRIPSGSVATENKYSVGCAWGDYDNDGNLDLFVVNGLSYQQNGSLYHNSGDGTFAQMASNTVGSIVSDSDYFAQCAWGDYDNDGYLDLFVTVLQTVAVNYLYHNNGDGTFSRVTSGSPVNDRGGSVGCAWGDYDNDGFLDLFVARGTHILPTANLLYRNNGNGNGWLKLKLVGTVSNRSAIGAKVRVKATIGGNTFWQLRELNTGSGYSSGPLEAHFGLGDSTNVDTVRIEWPCGTVQEFHNVAPKQILNITEPPRLLAGASNGVPQFSIHGGRFMQYDIQSSPSLATWTSVGSLTITNLNGVAVIVDTNAPGPDAKFYRAVSH
jgi:uncharacterized repeat protein (TIGR03803 family)